MYIASMNIVAPRRATTTLIAAVAAQITGGLFAQASPLVISGLMGGLSMTESQAGLVASVELFALAMTAIAIAPLLPRLPLRQLCAVAITATLVAQVLSILADQWIELVVLRGLSGLGEGVLYALSLSIVATHMPNPEKTFGYFQIIWAVGSVPLFSFGGELAATYGHAGIFGALAVVTLLLAPLLAFVPEVGGQSQKSIARESQGSSTQGLMILGSIFVFVAATGALYAFSGALGQRAGLGTAQVGYVLTLASLVGLIGAAGATWLNVRLGRVIPISAFCGLYVVVTLALCIFATSWVFAVAVVVSVVLYYFSIPYLFGIAASLDRQGRLAAAAGSSYLLGFAVAPIVGGVIIASAGYAALAIVVAAGIAAAWFLAVGVVLRKPIPMVPERMEG